MAPLHPEILYAQRSSESEAEKVRRAVQPNRGKVLKVLSCSTEHHLLHDPGAGYPRRA